ncbi:LAME_0H11144g1_1 [Lachancea meyersii CBS 8951]|uniref:LAME_0H11144g1_1 n=1 Tax=Lachancea meyersii CBS 8951 TaxID=1266667 RepID=A0A1G4KGG4_9SACH|nr:LAME_0H11144g1_1 [Lachancea meyersii CBS 8951]
MPLASFLYLTPLRVLKSLAGKIEWVIKNLVDYLITDDGGRDNQKMGVKDESGPKQTFKNPEGVRSLFPRANNVDTSLDRGLGPVPCALDLSTLQSPMSMVKTPEGHFEWRLSEVPMKSEQSKLDAASGTVSPTSNFTPKSTNGENGSSSEADAKRFICHICHAEFTVRGYLTRHIKKHAVEKAYQCPFYKSNVPKEERCHRHGGFSRRDTFKTHLRSRHFVYPKGIKSQDKAKSSGHCLHCNTFFQDTDDWIRNHVEKGECKGLPEGFKVVAKTGRKSGKLKMITTADGQSRFISTDQASVKPRVAGKKARTNTTAASIDSPGYLQGVDQIRHLASTTNDREANLKYEDSVGNVAPTAKNRHLDRISPGRSDGPSPVVTGQQLHPEPHYAFNYFTPPKTTPLDEAYFSVDPSPTDDAGLETVKSTSSASSRISFHEGQEKSLGMNGNGNAPPSLCAHAPSQDQSAFFQFPLDFDQCPMSFLDSGTHQPASQTQNGSNDVTALSMEMTSQLHDLMDKQMEVSALSEKNLRENQQYLNFYNHTFNSHL